MILVPADNLELVPETDNLQGLIPETLPASVSLPSRQQPPLVYREEPSVEGTAFAGRIQLRQRAVSVEVSSVFRAESERLQVEQSLAYEISYAPASELLLDVPRSVAESKGFRVTRDSRELSVRPVESAVSPSREERVVLRVELPQPSIGKCLLLVRYTVPLSTVGASEQKPVRIPLVQPLAEEGLTIANNAIQVVAAEDLSFELVDDQWNLGAEKAAVGFDRRSPASKRRGATRRDRVVGVTGPVRGQTQDRGPQSLAASLAHGNRTARSSLFSPDQRRAAPGGATSPLCEHTDSVEVWLSGQPRSDFTVTNRRTVVVDLERESTPAKRTLELFYWFTTIDPPIGRLTVEVPRVGEADRTGRFYCQLILPENEHLIWSSASLTQEAAWRWRGAYWSREGSLTQWQLEDWLLASHQEPLPQAVHQYLFSSMGSLQPRAFLSAKRYTLLLAFSGAVLGLGCLLLYVPVLRHSAFLLVAAVALGSLGLLYPDAALLAGQAAAVGLALVPLARLLQWIVSRRRLKQVAARTTTFVVPESQAGVVPVRPSEGSSRVGTTPHYPVAAAEPQP